MTKVTGIGVFIKVSDAKALAVWYDKYPGIPFGGHLYVDYKRINENNPAVKGQHRVFFL